jgi:chromosome segregation ATPase
MSAEVERLKADVRAAYAERDEMWERKAAALRERDEARRELERIRRALNDTYGEDYAGDDTAAEVERLFRHLGEHDDNVRRILQRKNEAIEKAQAERDALKAQLAEIAMAKVWTNEDGKRFVFADDLAAILLPAAT